MCYCCCYAEFVYQSCCLLALFFGKRIPLLELEFGIDQLLCPWSLVVCSDKDAVITVFSTTFKDTRNIVEHYNYILLKREHLA